jgi:hypothetical protein
MFSAAGWICIPEAEYADEFGDPACVPRQPTIDAISAALDRLIAPSVHRRSLRSRIRAVATPPPAAHRPAIGPHVLFRVYNGTWTVLIDTHRNHRHDWPEVLFREVAEIAPGSFGYMHVWDDEHPTESERFMRWAMVLGKVSVEEDVALRPVMDLLLDRNPPGT